MVMETSPGQFSDTTSNTYTLGPIPIQIEKADFNKDGLLDLAVLSIGTVANESQEYGQTLHILAGSPGGQFVKPYVIALRTTEMKPSFAVADMDADGWPDLALLEPDPMKVRIAWNAKSSAVPTFEEAAQAVSVDGTALPVRIAAGDLDLDGDDDIAVAASTPEGKGRVETIISGGRAGFVPSAAFSANSEPTCIALERIDGDASPDIIVGGKYLTGGRISLLLSDGIGGFGPAMEKGITGSPREIAAGDLDGNGLRDIAAVLPDVNRIATVLVWDSEGFIRGDANADASLDISDPVKLLQYLFAGGTGGCDDAMDADDNGALDLSDAVSVLEYLFLGGEAPMPPFPGPGTDPTEDDLGCGP
jgi:hypothetical protein